MIREHSSSDSDEMYTYLGTIRGLFTRPSPE